ATLELGRERSLRRRQQDAQRRSTLGHHHTRRTRSLAEHNARLPGGTRFKWRSVRPREVQYEGGLDIEALYEQYRVRMFRAIAGVVFDDAAAEDLTQETFERAWRSRDSY